MERVLVFKEENMERFSNKLFTDHISTEDNDITTLLSDCLDESFFVDRPDAEVDTTIKQVIPYAVIKSNNEYLVYKRTKRGGEGRLHENLSIGVGGHINPQDAIDDDPGTALALAMARELEEELAWPDNPYIDTDVIGVIYDPTNDVGKIHFGVLILCTIEGTRPVINENSLADINWYTKENIMELDNLENWSKLAVSVL